MKNVDDSALFKKVMEKPLEKSNHWEVLNHETQLYFNRDFKIFCQRVPQSGSHYACNIGLSPNKLTYCRDFQEVRNWAKREFGVDI